MENKIFKLSTGEQVNGEDLEHQIEKVCHYVKYAIVTGDGTDYPVALIFPNKKLLTHPDYETSPEEGCFCPRNLSELGRCITGCLNIVNNKMDNTATGIKSAIIINSELTSDERKFFDVEKYKAHINNMYGGNFPVEEEVYMIKLEK